MYDKKVLIQILNFNSIENTGDLYIKSLKSLKNQTYKNIKIIVIDNNSYDTSVNELEKIFPEIEVVKLNKNLGTIAHNIVMKKYYKDYDYILLANNDIVFKNNFIENFVEYANSKDDAGFLTPLILMLDNKNIVNSTGIIINKSGYAWDRDFGKDINEIKNRESGEVSFASGGALFLNTNVIKKTGFFDKIYFAYYEDVDLSMKLRKKTDYKIYFVKEALCYHKFSSSWGKINLKKEFYMMRNRYYFVIIHFPFRMMLNALRYLFFTSTTGNKKTNNKVFLNVFLMLPILLYKRLLLINNKIPLNLIEDYHGIPKLK